MSEVPNYAIRLRGESRLAYAPAGPRRVWVVDGWQFEGMAHARALYEQARFGESWHELAREANCHLPEVEDPVEDHLLARWEYDDEVYTDAGISPTPDHAYDEGGKP